MNHTSNMASSVSEIKVMIVDDHPLFRAGLQRALEFEDDIMIVATAENRQTAIEALAQHEIDIILMDINLPGMNGLQLTRELKQDDVEAAIVILTAHHDDEQVLLAMRTGAAAYCAKDIRPEELISIIRAVADGYYYAGGSRLSAAEYHEWLANEIQDNSNAYENDNYLTPLSPREMEILEYVTHGYINKEIALKLGISQQTVKNHMTSILKKLNVNDRTQAAITALRRGWVRLDNDSQQEF